MNVMLWISGVFATAAVVFVVLMVQNVSAMEKHTRAEVPRWRSWVAGDRWNPELYDSVGNEFRRRGHRYYWLAAMMIILAYGAYWLAAYAP
jgi:hypothetical protein